MARPNPEDIDLWRYERLAQSRGFRIIAGIDEAGRGPLAGPVVAAAVILPFGCDTEGIIDSKQLTPRKRDLAFDKIHSIALGIGVGISDAAEIDRVNILQATFIAMRSALAALDAAPDHVMVDGDKLIPKCAVNQQCIVGGDGRSAGIAAASIIAKVTRDRMMCEYDALYPQYGFAKHKGYGTREHLQGIAEHGPCPIHRRTFAPISQMALDFDSRADAPNDKNSLGARGEERTAAHLQRLGYTVVARNYSCRLGEIDIIARDGEDLVFVEVKTRRGTDFGSPAESVDTRKARRIVQAAQTYLVEHDLGEESCRFDIAEVSFSNGKPVTVELTKGAFDADL